MHRCAADPHRPHSRPWAPGFWLGVVVCAWAITLRAETTAELPTRGDCAPPSPPRPAALEGVVDGDTLRLADGDSVRLIGINTPELHRDAGPEPGARAARAALRRLLRDHQHVWLATDRAERDPHGRRLAFVYRRGDSAPLSAQLLRRGLGWHIAVPPNLALQDCLAAAEREARAHQRGVWARQALTPQQLEEGGFALLRVRIQAVVSDRNGWWLETGGRLVLRLLRRDLVHFDEPNPESWVGRRLLVRGWVIDRSAARSVREHGYAPLLLRLRHPAMLEALPADA